MSLIGRWRGIGLALMLSLLTLDGRLPAQTEAPKAETITVKVVDYAELGNLVRAHKGQVVVVDLWNIT